MFPTPELEEFLGKVYDHGREGDRKDMSAEEYARRRHDFVFHMTDWLSDLKFLSDLYEHPEKADVEKTTIEIMGFLFHVLPHLTTAGRLLLDEIGDAFANDWPVRKVGKSSMKKSHGKKSKVLA